MHSRSVSLLCRLDFMSWCASFTHHSINIMSSSYTRSFRNFKYNRVGCLTDERNPSYLLRDKTTQYRNDFVRFLVLWQNVHLDLNVNQLRVEFRSFAIHIMWYARRMATSSTCTAPYMHQILRYGRQFSLPQSQSISISWHSSFSHVNLSFTYGSPKSQWTSRVSLNRPSIYFSTRIYAFFSFYIHLQSISLTRSERVTHILCLLILCSPYLRQINQEQTEYFQDIDREH